MNKEIIYDYISDLKSFVYNRFMIKKILSLGFPTSLQMFFEVGLFTSSIWLSGLLGEIPQKKAENMYNKDSARKSNISSKKIFFFQFFNFLPKARGPLKIFDAQFPKIFKNKLQKWLLRDLSGMERNKVRKFCEPSPSPPGTTVGFMVIWVKLNF